MTHDEDKVEKVARYLGGIRFNIHYEISLNVPNIVEDCYKLVARAEEKMRR